MLCVASLDKPQVTRRGSPFTTRDIDSGAGTYVGDLHGAGSLLVYATWKVCDTGEPAFKRLPGARPPGTIYNAKLWRIDGTTGKKLIASAPRRARTDRGRGRPDPRGPRATGRSSSALPTGTSSRPSRSTSRALQATLGPKKLVVAVRDARTLPLPKAKLEFQRLRPRHGRARADAARARGRADRHRAALSVPDGSSPAACLSPAARLRFQDADATRLVYVLDSTVHVLGLANGKDMTYAGARGARVRAARGARARLLLRDERPDAGPRPVHARQRSCASQGGDERRDRDDRRDARAPRGSPRARSSASAMREDAAGRRRHRRAGATPRRSSARRR